MIDKPPNAPEYPPLGDKQTEALNALYNAWRLPGVEAETVRQVMNLGMTLFSLQDRLELLGMVKEAWERGLIGPENILSSIEKTSTAVLEQSASCYTNLFHLNALVIEALLAPERKV